MKLQTKTGPDGETFAISSGNIFADLDLPDADLCLRKAELLGQILRLIRSNNLTRAAVAKRASLSEPQMANLFGARLDNFSEEQLVAIFSSLEHGRVPSAVSSHAAARV